MKLFIRLLMALLFLFTAFYVVLFCLRNDAHVDIDFFFFQLPQVPIELAVIVAFVLGGLAGLLASTQLLYRMRKKHRKALALSKQQ